MSNPRASPSSTAREAPRDRRNPARRRREIFRRFVSYPAGGMAKKTTRLAAKPLEGVFRDTHVTGRARLDQGHAI